MFVRFFYILLLCIFCLVENKIDIRDASVATISRDDIGMIFYVTIHNDDTCSYDLKVSMLECSEAITDKDHDNTFMYLVGGNMGLLKPKCYKNVTLLYPNMYLHNRRGYCVISLKFRSPTDYIIQKKANISFDTWISKHSQPLILQGYYTRNEVRQCSTHDLDPLNSCRPVDCHMKYLGTRNYFNHMYKRCQKVPICIADATKEMPDIIYSISNNKCRDMEKTVTKGDLQTIEAGTLHGACDESYHQYMNLNCHYGKVNTNTGMCECDEGWMSPPMNKDQSDSANLLVYHMCNIEVGSWYDASARKIKMICLIVGVLAVVIAMIIVTCSFFIQQCYNCIKSFERQESLYGASMDGGKVAADERCIRPDLCGIRKNEEEGGSSSEPCFGGGCLPSSQMSMA